MLEIKPLTKGQREIVRALSEDYDIVGIFGPTITGKFFSLAYGIKGSELSGNTSNFIST